MRFWWLIPVVLAVVAIATVVGWLLARRAGVRSGKKGWVANTGYLRGLPKYQALVRRTRASLTCGACRSTRRSCVARAPRWP